MLHKLAFTLLFISLLLCGKVAFSQQLKINDPLFDYLRIMDLTGEIETDASYLIRPINQHDFQIPSNSSNLWFNKLNSNSSQLDPNKEFQFKLYSPHLFQSYNSELPAGNNDGPLWQGKGSNTLFSLGIWAKFKFVEISLNPELTYSENRFYEIPPFAIEDSTNEFSQYFTSIDIPYRFGENKNHSLNYGQSYLKINTDLITFGVSTENIWVGPSRFNPIVMSNNANGFGHFFAKTSKPIQTRAGIIESRIYWGFLRESDYFDKITGNNRKATKGFIIAYTPSFAKSINIGYTRTLIEPTSNDIFSLLNSYRKSDNRTNKMNSLMVRWKPEIGNEIYLEYAKNGKSINSNDLLLEIEHSRAFTLGALKTVNLTQDSFLLFNIELTQLENPKPGLFRDYESFYSDSTGFGGYTNAGQVMGAAIGPGSNSQYLGLSYYHKWGNINLFYNRIVYNNDQLYLNLNDIQIINGARYSLRRLHDVELRGGISSTIFIKNIELNFNIWKSLEYNRYNLYKNDIFNTHIDLTLRYAFKNLLR